MGVALSGRYPAKKKASRAGRRRRSLREPAQCRALADARHCAVSDLIRSTPAPPRARRWRSSPSPTRKARASSR